MLEQIWQKIQGLYLPTPKQALDQRAYRPFHTLLKNQLLRVTGDITTETRGDRIYTSPALDCKGFTLQNCYLGIKVPRDTADPNTGWSLLFTLVFEGSCGSPWVELATAQLHSNGEKREFPAPILARDSLSTQVRLSLYAGDNSQSEQPAIPRRVDILLDGVLSAGAGF